jgi:hypothetical protein
MSTDSMSILCLKSEIVTQAVLTSVEIAGTRRALQHHPSELTSFMIQVQCNQISEGQLHNPC